MEPIKEYHDEDDMDLCASGQAKIDRIYNQLEILLKKPSKLAVCTKWFISIFCSFILLLCVVLGKFAVIELATMMGKDGNCTSLKTQDKKNCETSFVLLIVLLLAPNFINLVRFMWTSICNDKRQWPTQSKMLLCAIISIIEAIGLCLFTFKVLPKEKKELVILLMDCVFMGHIVATSIDEFRSFTMDKLRSCARAAISLLAINAGAVITFYITYENLNNKEDITYFVVAISCLTISWLPWLRKKLIQSEPSPGEEKNRVQSEMNNSRVEDQDSNNRADRKEFAKETNERNTPLACSNMNDKLPGGPKQEMVEVYTHKMLIISSFIKILTIIVFACVLQHIDRGSNMDTIRRIRDVWVSDLDITQDIGRQKIYLIVNVILSFLGYIVGIYALKTQMNILGFVLPLLLATPLTFWLLYVPNLCSDLDMSKGVKLYVETICFNYNKMEYIEYLVPALFLLWLAQFLSTGFYVLGSPACILQHEVKLFWMPMYNSLFLDQYMLLDRRTILTEDLQELPQNLKKKQTKVFICTTMYRETREEMKQLLESIARINEAKQYGTRDFESHIIVDGGIKNDVTGEKALQLLSLVLEVLKTNGLGTIAASPYGLRLTWSLRPSNGARCNRPMTFVVHLKDSKKVKNKKRWSQVMYMSYILDFLLKQDSAVSEEDAYILTTDADVKFSPDSVEALLDLMTRDVSVGAVCARTYPLGTGPLLWYQEFEYSIGHWLQKTAEHVMGTVLCAPGCFSVYRVKAIRDILPIYATDVEKGMEFLTKDMGEDRWLCTLLVQSGWRIDYCAASCNYTNSPAEFDEFFTQRRRWIGSTIANSFLLMKEWNIVNKVNQDLSVFYLVYQSCLMCSTLLGPSTVILIVSSGLSYAWGLNMVVPTCVQCIVLSFYCLVCLKTTKKTQHQVAKVLTFIYAIIMVFVLIGTVEGTVHNVSSYRHQHSHHDLHHSHKTTRIVHHKNTTMDGKVEPMSITTVYVIGIVTMFPVAGLIHLTESASLLKGVSYLLCLPSTYILLIIYSFCNITDRSWGTRDKQQEDTVESESWYKLISNELKSIFIQYKKFRTGREMHLGKSNDGRKETTVLVDNLFEQSTEEYHDEVSKQLMTDGQQDIDLVNEQDISTMESEENAATIDALQQEVETPEKTRSKRPVMTISDSVASGLDILCRGEDVHLWGSKGGANKVIKVEDWIGQTELLPLFKKYGYDNTSFIATMTEADLERIGVKERTQRNLLMRRINDLHPFSYAAFIPDNVYEWLCYIGLEEYTEQFATAHITTTDDLEQLTSFTRKDVETELKITKPAHIRRLLDAAVYLRTPTKEERINNKIRRKLTNAPRYAIERISPEDYSYWNRLIECFLKPTSDGFSIEWTLKTELEDLRNTWLFILFLVNALWLILIITVALKVDLIIFGSSPVAFGFFVVFGILLLVQFFCMILHRLSTLAHFLARTPYRFGDKYRSSWSYTSDDDIQALADVKKSVEECRRIEKALSDDEERKPLMLRKGEDYIDMR